MKQTSEHIKNRIEARRRNGTYIFSKETKIKMSKAQRGKKLSEEQKKKISDSLKGRIPKNKVGGWNKGLKMSKQYREVRSGENSSQWNGGITSEYKKIKNSAEYRNWRDEVFKRDNWICQKTKMRGGNLHPHHINNFAEFPELRFELENGITLSEKSHRDFHRKYGRKNNNLSQIIEFLSEVEI